MAGVTNMQNPVYSGSPRIKREIKDITHFPTVLATESSLQIAEVETVLTSTVILITCGACICKFAHLLKFLCNPKVDTHCH